jgi:glutaredoxin 2
MPESMDIVHYIDQIDGKPILTGESRRDIINWLHKVNDYSSKLLLPRFAEANFEEFATDSARKYFSDKNRPLVEISTNF